MLPKKKFIKGASRSISLRVPDELYKKILEYSHHIGWSKSKILEYILDSYFQNMDKLMKDEK